MTGTKYCIGPMSVSGRRSAECAKSNSGTAVARPVSITNAMSPTEAPWNIESDRKIPHATIATAGRASTLVSALRLSSGCSDTCFFNKPYTAHDAAIASAKIGGLP